MGEFFKREVFRPFVTLFVPGGIAILPYVVQLLFTFPDLSKFAQSNPGASLVVFLMFAIAAGLVIEDVGARIEFEGWDRLLDRAKEGKRAQGEHTMIWERYLQLTFPTDPVGQHYLRTVLIRLKFELGMIVAIPISWAGFLWLHLTIEMWTWIGFLVGSGISLVVLIYLVYESYGSAKTLGRVRSVLVAHYGEPPNGA